MFIDLANTDQSWQDVYKIIVSFVNPRPIALVSSISPDGVRNLAPFSFYNMVSANPPIMMVCPSRTRDHGKKDTQVNIEATGEFVVATVTRSIADAMNDSSAPYAPEVDEFEKCALTPTPASIVKPSLVAESPVNCECKLDRIIEFGDEPGAGAVIFGRLVAIHAKDEFIADDGALDPEKLQTIGRLGRNSYATTADRFDLPRPQLRI
ncbi:MAG TPA: flavin reductase family protein [Phycisphaerae bacterium]|nr:flavin reductase family protein [Phycisphaerae bacterium]